MSTSNEQIKIKENYNVDDEGVIRSPGKFEGEPMETVYFYEASLEGFADATLYDGESIIIDLFDVTDADHKAFPGRLDDVKCVQLEYSDTGFVYYSEHTDRTSAQIEEAHIDAQAPQFDPEAGDISTEDHRRFYQYGKLWLDLGSGWPDEMTRAEANAMIRRTMEMDNFFPSVWFISDHGNAHLIDLQS